LAVFLDGVGQGIHARQAANLDSMRKLPIRQGQHSIDQHSEQLRDLPCAISWADREFEGRDAVVLENSKELRAEIKRLNQQIN
jgi:hypothetical protein